MSKKEDEINDFSNYQYEKLMDKLKEDLNNTEDDEKKVQIYVQFLGKYMMPKELWTDLLKISNKQHPYYMMYRYNPIYHNLVKNGPYYFLYNQQGSQNAGYQLKVYENFNGFYETADTAYLSGLEEILIRNEKKLLFPHQELHYIFIRYERDRFSPISNEFRKKVTKMEELFWNIKASEKDTEKWFSFLKEIDDNSEFLKQNVENQLLNNLSNKELWKLYINFWKKRDLAKMLQIYSNYCRYFLDDKEMKEKYAKEVKKHGPIFVKWKNPFDFENVGEEFPPLTSKDAYKTFVSRKEQPSQKPPFVCSFIDFVASMVIQEWLLPKPIIRYISLQTFLPTSEKLLKTCKYFLKQNTVLYCYKAAFVNKHYFSNYKITEKSFLISIPSLDFSPFKKNIYITDVLIFDEGPKDFRDSSISLNLSKAIKNNIYKCDAKFMDIKSQILTEKEFLFLVGHGNVRYLILNDIHIFKDGYREEEEEMSLDEILELTSKLEYLSINVGNLRLSKNTLSELEFTQKFIYFQVSSFSNIISYSDYCNFLKKAPCSKFSIQFGQSVDENLYKIFEENVTQFVNEWEPSYQKPVLTFTRR